MFPYRISFNSPAYLLLLLLVPALWWLSFRNLSGLGKFRRLLALSLRSLALVALVMGLAEAQWGLVSDRLTVLYVVDNSLSVSSEQGKLSRDYVNAAMHRRFVQDRQDSAGVIVFGREAAVELPPWDEEQHWTQVESTVDREYTNLADALKLARASFRYDTAKRIVILSDGNENLGNAAEEAQAAVDAGISIDVAPLEAVARGDIAVEKVSIPGDIRRGQPFEARVVVTNTAPAGSPPVKGKLQIVRRSGEREQDLLTAPQDEVSLTPGKHVFTVRETLDEPDFYTYDAHFTPLDPADDAVPQNNRATTFTHIRGRGRVLLIRNDPAEDDNDDAAPQTSQTLNRLVAGLRAKNLEVTVRSTRPEELPRDLAELQPFDTVVLANAPRESFTDAQIDMLAQNTQRLGSGLVMFGGPNSFGPGGWDKTPLEAAMPVDFHVKNLKVTPTSALILVLDVSGSMAGDKLEMSKAAAIAAVKILSPRDFVGVVIFDEAAHWVVPMRKLSSPSAVIALIQKIGPGGGTFMMPGMTQGYDAIEHVEAAVKHMIVLTDGQTSGDNYDQLAASKRRRGITTTSVAVGDGAAVGLMQQIATAGGGKFYSVNNPRMIPRIFVTEASRIARPQIYEKKEGFAAQAHLDHEMIRGLADALPPITGYVLTTAKENGLVEVALATKEPPGLGLNPVLASWNYGLGKAVAFTTDFGQRWANGWTNWEGYDKLFSQIVSWSMRQVDDSGKFTVTTDVQDGVVKVIATATDENGDFVNYLNVISAVVGPDRKPVDLEVKQTAPGRYVGQFTAVKRGNYFISLSPGVGKAPVRVGVNMSYSDEFREREANDVLLKNIARLTPRHGEEGHVIQAPISEAPPQRLSKMLETDSFRHDLPRATRNQDIWHLLVLCGACLFFGDVFVRRVNVNFAWVPPLVAKARDRVLRREGVAAPSVVIDRLRSRKAEISDQLDQRRAAATRFEPTESPASDQQVSAALDEATAPRPSPASRPAASQSLSPDKPAEAESYTARLLKAKQKVWEEKKDEKK